MAMRAIMKKISPNIRFMEGLRRVPRFLSSVAADTKDVNKEMVVVRDDLEKLLKDHGSKVRKITMSEFCREANGQRHQMDRRWEDWVFSSNDLWKEKNEEEKRAELDMRWTCLRNLLHSEGIDTSNHRLLLSMKEIEADDVNDASEWVQGTIEFKLGSPDRGLVSINRLVLGHCWPSILCPRQTVRGLLCLSTSDAFRIYNPINGEKSPWIKTKKPGNIAFGFNPQSEEHNIICISDNESGSDDQVVEIFTVGKNTWRRIDAVPPVSIYVAPFYVDGCLYWRFREVKRGELELILRFDIATEEFRVISIPDFVIDPERLVKRTQTVELTEIDGRIAVLDWISELEISLWTFHEEADGNIKWTEEVIDMPPHWNGKPDLSIEALTGTDLIFIRSQNSDSVFYYNRSTKESIRFPVSPDCVPWTWERIIQV